MTERCTDLDAFFDGELAADQADRFRHHLPTCERCQRVLDGRMQESIAVRAPARASRARDPAPALAAAIASAAPAVTALTGTAPAVDREPGAPDSAAPAAARTRARRGPTRAVCVRALTYAVPLVAAAAAIPLWLAHRGDSGLELSLSVERAPGVDRDRADLPPHGLVAHIGDTLRPSARGARHRAIGVYLGERLIAACPGDARCSDRSGDLVLDLPLTDHGRHAILALSSGDPLPAPGPTLDATRAAARRAGIRTELQYVEVQ
jgi:hypothetical protein